MAFPIQIKRGIKANIPVLLDGELFVSQDERKLYSGSLSGNIVLGSVYESTSLPSINNDGVDTASLGLKFKNGDFWLKSNTDLYVCFNNATGSATWKRLLDTDDQQAYLISTDQTGYSVQDHIDDINNPHSVSKTQVGLSNVPNVNATDPSNINQTPSYRFVTDTEKSQYGTGYSHSQTTGNPHGTTASDISTSATGQSVQEELDSKATIVYVDEKPTTYAGISELPTISYVSGSSGQITISSCKAFLHESPGWDDWHREYTLAGITPTLTANVYSYVIADYNNGTPVLSITTNPAVINSSSVLLVAHVYWEYQTSPVAMDDVHYFIPPIEAYGKASKIANRLINTNRYERSSGLIISETGDRNIKVTQGVVWYASSNFVLSEIDTSQSGETTHFYYHSSGNWVVDNTGTQYNNSQYDNGTNLVSLSPNRYTVNWVYRSTNHASLFVVLGDGDFKLNEAVTSTPPSIPTLIMRQAILVGRIIVQNGESTAAEIDSAFTVVFPGTTTNHNDLNNIQGGTTGFYYHSDQEINQASSPTFAGATLTGFSNFIKATAGVLGSSTTNPDQISIDTKMSTGIVNIHNSETELRVNTTLSFDDTSKIFSIAPSTTGESFSIYLSGTKYTFNTAQTVDLTSIIATDTLYFIYFNSSGVLTAGITAWDINSSNAPIATLFWNGTTHITGDERHDAGRNLGVHKLIHKNFGTRWTYGLSGTFATGSMTIALGMVSDEELEIYIPQQTTAKVWYTLGSKATFDGITSEAAYISGGALQYNPSGAFADVTSGYYIRNYIYATNDIDSPIAVIVGQNQYTNINDTRNDPFPIQPTYINNELKLLYTTIYQNVGGTPTYVEATDYRSAPTQPNGTLAVRPIFLDQIEDVSAPTPSVDQVLTWNGTQWVAKAGSTASASAGISFYDATPIITAYNVNSNITQILTSSRTPVTTTEQTYALTGTVGTIPYSSCLYNTALGRTVIDAGTWQFNLWAVTSSTGGGRTSALAKAVYVVSTQDGGTITITVTGTGTSRTVDASGGTPFATTKITASATNTVASYLQTPTGLYQITARASDTQITIATPTNYVNDAAGTVFNVWSRLFLTASTTNLTTTAAQYVINSVQSSFATGGALTITTASKIGFITFLTQTVNTSTVTTYYNGTTRQSYVNTPFITTHNSLAGLQGGDGTDYYHLSLAQHTIATQAASGSVAGYVTTGTQTITGAKTFSSDTTFSKAVIETPATVTVTSSGVAIPITNGTVEVTTDGDSDLDIGTLANGTVGQVIDIYVKAVGNAADTFKIVPAVMLGRSEILFSGNPLGKGARLVYTASGWVCTGVFDYSKDIVIKVDGNDFTLTSGTKTPYTFVPFSGTITGWDLLCSASDTLTADILYNATFSSAPTSITGTGTKPNVSGAASASGTTLTNWTTTSLTRGGVITVSLSGTLAAATWLILRIRVS